MAETIESPAVPREYCGKWIAWDFEETRIIASADTFAEARNAAIAAGEPRPVLAKVPHADQRMVHAKAQS